MELGRALRVQLGQLPKHGLAAHLIVALLQLLPGQARLIHRAEAAALDERVYVQPRPADHYGQFPPGKDVLAGRLRRVHKLCGGPAFCGLGHVYHVVRHAIHLLSRGLGRTDVHAPVDLHGVRGDHLSAQLLCQKHAELRLSRRRRACDNHYLVRHKNTSIL